MDEFAEDNDDGPFDCYIKTKRNMINYSIKWEIENFFSIPDGETLISPDFQPVLGKNCYFKVTKLDKDLLVILCFDSSHDLLVQCVFSILNTKGVTLYKRTSEPLCIDQYFLTDPGIKTSFSNLNSSSNEKLIFKCSLKIYRTLETHLCSTGLEAQDELEVMKTLANDFKILLDSSVHTDVILIMKDGQVAAHKAVLSARSPVFNKMFQHEMNETKNNVVEIDDLKLLVVKKFLSFLYSGEFSYSNNDVYTLCNLYYAADKYDVLCLQKLCGDAIIKKLDVDNACEILAFMDCHDDKAVKTKVIQFISLNLSKIVSTPGWSAFMNSQLSAEVIKQTVCNV